MVVVLEDVVWAGARAVLRALVRLGPVRNLHQLMGRLPGWAAVPLFILPEAIGRGGEVWAVALLLRGHTVSFLLVYALVRLLATLLAVFVYQACEAALLRIAWFATLVRWTLAIRDWALAELQPLRDRLQSATRIAPGFIKRRFISVRRSLARLIDWRGNRGERLP